VTISVLLFSSSSYALSSYTTNFIHGSAPYLTFDEGQTKVTDTNHLLDIRLSDGRLFTRESNNSTATNPIELANLGESFADIEMFIPTNTNSIPLSTVIGAPYNYWRDDDGDGQDNLGITITGNLDLKITDKDNKDVSRNETLDLCKAPYTGNLDLKITDKDNKDVSRNETLDLCKAPYKVTLSSTSGTLSTSYGVPNSSDFIGNSATYYINPKVIPKVCFAKPNMDRSKNEFAGPDSMWDPEKGFLVQSTTPSSYDKNFPTTGANGLYFDLIISGSHEPLSWSAVPNDGKGGITIDVGYDPKKPDTSVVRVKIKGYIADNRQRKSDSPSHVKKPTLPQTFELIGKGKDIHNNDVVVKYGFQLQKWFILRGQVLGDFTPQIEWCDKIGYRATKIKDLTNAKYEGVESATPLSSGNYFQRHIGAGFFTEWGTMQRYSGAEFPDIYNFWQNDEYKKKPYVASQTNGFIRNYAVKHFGDGGHVLCVTP